MDNQILIILGGFISSFIGTLALAIFFKEKSIFKDKRDKYHAVHTGDVPRSGGIILYILFLAVSSFFSKDLFIVNLAFLPTFLYSIYEDIRGDTPQKIRLLFMTFSTVVAVLLTGILIKDAQLFYIPLLLQIPLTVFAVVGLTSAINFIDGLNGLASGVSILTFIFISISLYLSGHIDLTFLSIIFASIVFGFFIVNFFTGKIFLGDTGAYFLGYFIGMFSIYLINKTSISPWFFLSLVSYPVIETMITIYRRIYRKKNRGREFFKAEKVHLHTMLYKRYIRISNSLSSFIILMVVLIFDILSLYFYQKPVILILLISVQFFIYLVSYRFLFREYLRLKEKNRQEILELKLKDT